MTWLGCPHNTFTGAHVPTEAHPDRCGRCGAWRGDERAIVKGRRNTDPAASHLASAAIQVSGRAGSLRSRAFHYIRNYPGMTAGEIGDMSGLGHDKVWRRISELKREGLVYYGVMREWNGSMQHTIWPVE